MAVTAASFRALLTAFGDASVYTDASISAWIAVALQLLNPNRWGASLDIGTTYFVAHHLVVEEQSRRAAAAGGTPGKLKGPTSAQGVDKVSASYDTGAISLDNMAFWGLSTYGLRFLQLARTMGAGGLSLLGGGPPSCGYGGFNGLI